MTIDPDPGATPVVAMPEERLQATPEAGLIGRAVDRLSLPFALGIVAAAAILMSEVVLRYVFGAPTIWAHETAVMLCALAFLFGGLLCVSQDRHIRVTILHDLLPARLRRGLDAAVAIGSAAAACIFAWASWLVVERAVWTPGGEIRLERSGSAWNPPIPAMLKIFLCVILVLMTAQFLVIAAARLRASIRGGPAEDAATGEGDES